MSSDNINQRKNIITYINIYLPEKFVKYINVTKGMTMHILHHNIRLFTKYFIICLPNAVPTFSPVNNF